MTRTVDWIKYDIEVIQGQTTVCSAQIIAPTSSDVRNGSKTGPKRVWIRFKMDRELLVFAVSSLHMREIIKN